MAILQVWYPGKASSLEACAYCSIQGRLAGSFVDPGRANGQNLVSLASVLLRAALGRQTLAGPLQESVTRYLADLSGQLLS